MEEKYTLEERMVFIKNFLSNDEYAKLYAHAMAMQFLIDIAMKRAENAIKGEDKK